MTSKQVVAIIGGGAAGFFAALQLAERSQGTAIHIFEKSSKVLGKVKVSGGGRCNVTHACFHPAELVQYYPRGQKELRGPFSRFGPLQTIEWFEARGVKLKTEADGRMFPVTDNSQTIIDTFLREQERLQVKLHVQTALTGLEHKDGRWELMLNGHTPFLADAVLLAAGSSTSMWEVMKQLDIQVAPPVPSLFTFHIPDKKLHALSGLSMPLVETTLPREGIAAEGPLLITHWGMSGPAVLKLSAFGARKLHDTGYTGALEVNYLPGQPNDEVLSGLKDIRTDFSRKNIHSQGVFPSIPKRLWHFLLMRANIPDNLNWADLSNKQLQALADELTRSRYPISGKSTFKEEFVTCGGVCLREINFRDYSSRRCPGLYFAGEFIDVDAVTGGFNFQHAWTSAYVAAHGIAEYLQKKEGDHSSLS